MCIAVLGQHLIYREPRSYREYGSLERLSFLQAGTHLRKQVQNQVTHRMAGCALDHQVGPGGFLFVKVLTEALACDMLRIDGHR